MQHVELSAPRAYLDVDLYRRGVTLLELAPDLQVLVDLFRVKGGWAHDYSFHGFAGDFSTQGVSFQRQEGGTLAGPKVPFRKLCDDPELERHANLPGLPGTDGKRSYHSYRGSGFSYLYDVKRGQPAGEFQADWLDEEMGLDDSHAAMAGFDAVIGRFAFSNTPGVQMQVAWALSDKGATQREQGELAAADSDLRRDPHVLW